MRQEQPWQHQRCTTLWPRWFLDCPLGLYRAGSLSGAMGLLPDKPLRPNVPWAVSTEGCGKWGTSCLHVLLGGRQAV